MALNFNNSTDEIILSDRISTSTNNFTMHAWVKAQLPQQTGAIFYNGSDASGYGLMAGAAFDGSGSKLIGLMGGVSWLDPGANMTDDTWHSVLFIRDAGTTTLYVDNTGAGSFANTPGTPTSGKASIGSQFIDSGSSKQRYVDADIAEVAFWESALGSTDRAALAAGTPPEDLSVAPSFHMTLEDDSGAVLTGSVSATVTGTTVVAHPITRPSPSVLLKIKLGGSFAAVPAKVKVSGSFVEGSVNIL